MTQFMNFVTIVRSVIILRKSLLRRYQIETNAGLPWFFSVLIFYDHQHRRLLLVPSVILVLSAHNPDDGISIPESYSSYIAPLQSAKLYNEVRSCRDKDKHHLAHVESPYVVFLHNKREIAPSQLLFTFQHPNRGKYTVLIMTLTLEWEILISILELCAFITNVLFSEGSTRLSLC